MDEDFKRRSLNIKRCFQSYQIKCSKNEELAKVVNELQEQLNLSNKTIAHYKQILNTFNNAESCSVLYNSLKLKFSEIHNENGELKQRLLALEEKCAQEKRTIIGDYEGKIAELTSKFTQHSDTLTHELQKRISCYESQVADLKENLELKENYMNNQIQLCQASADLQVDEAEVKWKTLLESVNLKLKESNSTCFNLRNQIIALRNTVASQTNEIEKLVQERRETEEKLLHTENQLISAQEKLLQNQHSTVKRYSGGKQRYNKSRTSSSYKVKENASRVNQSSNSSRVLNLSNKGNERASQEPTLDYENLHAVQGLYKTKQNVCLPPLHPCADSGGNTSGRKRKLFNPNSNEYLDEMDNQD